MSLITLGNKLRDINSETQNYLFSTLRLSAIANEAFGVANLAIKNDSRKKIPFVIPIGVRADGTPYYSDKNDLKKEFLLSQIDSLTTFALPLTGIYQVVTIIEAWMSDCVRSVVTEFPQKLGKDKKIPLKTVLSCGDLESVYIAATDEFVRDLMYKSPKEYGEIAGNLLGVEFLAMPAYFKYIEIKATRDVMIHNKGVANDIYEGKAGTHARVKSGEEPPVTPAYFLDACETALTLVELSRDSMKRHWGFEDEAETAPAGDSSNQSNAAQSPHTDTPSSTSGSSPDLDQSGSNDGSSADPENA